MSRSIIQVSVPSMELVQPSDMDAMLHGFPTGETSFLELTIAAARDHIEGMTGYCLAPRDFIQYEDRFPMQSVYSPLVPVPLPLMGVIPAQAYARRNPYEIALLRNPAQSISQIVYTDLSGTPQTLTPGTDFTADATSVPARVLPKATPPGTTPVTSFWPACLPGPKAVAIYFNAGYYTAADQLTTEATPRDMGAPPILKVLVMALAQRWFIYRDSYGEVPKVLEDLILSNRVVDYNPGIQ